MIDPQLLRKTALNVLKNSPRTQAAHVLHGVEQFFKENDLFPSKESCGDDHASYGYYQGKQLSPGDKLRLDEIIWDLIIERILTVGMDNCNRDFPFIRLTDFGEVVVAEGAPPYYSPDEYREVLKSSVQNIDEVVEQYAVEGVKCYRQRLFFASAVMLGAAAESALLSLLESMTTAESDHKKQGAMQDLVNRPNLPKIFDVVKLKIEALIKAKKIPYKTHEGAFEHLLSLFEMVRVQRNDAVHPAIGEVDQMKVFLSIQSLPAALDIVFRLKAWFEENKTMNS